MDLYAEQIIDHAKHPRHTGSIPHASTVHEEHNPSCGDAIHVEIRIADGLVEDLGWSGNGCAISQASMSLLSEHVIGWTIENVLSLKKVDVLELLGVPVSARRMKCALLGLHTLQNALRLSQAMPSQSWVETVADPPPA